MDDEDIVIQNDDWNSFMQDKKCKCRSFFIEFFNILKQFT